MDRGLGTTRWAICMGSVPAYGERKGGRALESPETCTIAHAAE